MPTNIAEKVLEIIKGRETKVLVVGVKKNRPTDVWSPDFEFRDGVPEPTSDSFRYNQTAVTITAAGAEHIINIVEITGNGQLRGVVFSEVEVQHLINLQRRGAEVTLRTKKYDAELLRKVARYG